VSSCSRAQLRGSANFSDWLLLLLPAKLELFFACGRADGLWQSGAFIYEEERRRQRVDELGRVGF
jgi:hypothetical protein